MKNRVHTSAALAAVTLLSAGSYVAAQQSAANRREGSPAGQPAASVAPNEQQAAQLGEQTNKAVSTQLRQFAQDPQTAPDKLFLLNAAIDSTAEIAYSQQAVQKAENDQVKKLAQQMIEDHEKLNQRLQQTAQQLGVQVPEALPRMKQQEIEILSSLSGRDFEQQYVAHMDAAHAKDVACFRAASALSQNPQVKQFASESLPTLERHRHMVDEIAESMKILTREDRAVPAAETIRGSGGGTNQGKTPSGSETPAPGR